MNNAKSYLSEKTTVFTEQLAIEEASRCLLCHDAPCSKKCPSNTNPAEFIRAIRFGNFLGAAEIIRKNNILGGACSQICPFKEHCESECNRAKIDKAVKIGKLQRFAIEYEKKSKIQLITPPLIFKAQKVAVIGGGPAGLSCAGKLIQKGYKVTIFEKNSKAGGLLSYGIAPVRLPQKEVDSEIEYIKKLGVDFIYNSEFGRDFNLDNLRQEGFSAFLFALGNQTTKHLGIPGAEYKNIHTAIDILSKSKSTDGNIKIGNNVIIIGGGDVAMDAAATVKLLGAKDVTILYRRRLEDMPATEAELDYVKSLNIEFITGFTPTEYLGKENVLTGIKAEGTYHKSSVTLESDMIIEAIGQKAKRIDYPAKLGLDEKNLIKTEEETGKTNIAEIFAAGDIVNGGETVVRAVQMGKDAAHSIEEYLRTIEVKTAKPKIKPKHKSLEIEFCGVKCENPFFLSSSPVGSNYEMCSKALETGWGGIVYKTIGQFIADECSPRFDNIRKESTSFIGFKNMEQISDKPLEKNLEMMAKLKKNYPNKILIASIMGSNEKEWTELSKLVTEVGVDMIECNFSCPQMTSSEMGSDVGQNLDLVRKYSVAVRKGTSLPILAKMTPNIGNMEPAAIAAIEGGATSIAAINTIKSITGIDLDKLVGLPIVNGKSSISGYSGKAVKPIALRFIAQLAVHPELRNIPISGMGGIETWQDAIEFILLGSRNLQVTTAVMQYGYRIVEDLINGTSTYLERKGVNTLDEIAGKGLNNIIPAEDLDRSFIIYPEFGTDNCINCGRCYISCFDGGHQAIKWNNIDKLPELDKEKCVGCHLCSHVCPVNCISPGDIEFKKDCTPHNIIF